MYKMVLKIRKETWEKCGIKTVKHYIKKIYIIELWNKMSDFGIQLGYSNIYDITLKRIIKYCQKIKNKRHYKKRKTKI